MCHVTYVDVRRQLGGASSPGSTLGPQACAAEPSPAFLHGNQCVVYSEGIPFLWFEDPSSCLTDFYLF